MNGISLLLPELVARSGFDCFACRNGAEIARVVIAKAYRGNGLSCKMVGEIQKILCDRGCKAIHLSVAKANIPACKTYGLEL